MLQDKPKKIKDYSNPTKMQLFWRTQGECWRRAITPFLMYLFTSLLAFALQAIDSENVTVLEVVLGSICIVGGAAFNAHLLYHTGKMHYDSYLTGCIHRRNAIFGIASGGDHRIEREFRIWKGFLIGFLVGVPVILFAFIGHFWSGGELALMMFAGWAIFPVQWIEAFCCPNGLSAAWAMLVVLLPMLVSGAFYLVGAYREKKIKEEEAARAEAVQTLAEEAANAQKERHAQTEEQRKKTLQSKKKK